MPKTLNETPWIERGFTAVLLCIFFGVLYGATLHHGIGGRTSFGDSVKWQYLWAINGTPHPTGYPLFLLLSELFGNTLVIFEPHLRITLISTVAALGAIVFTHWLACELVANRWLRLVPPLFLGTTHNFWALATEPEVYTLNAFFVASVSFFFARFHATRDRRLLLIACALYGVSFGNNLTMILMLPGIVFLTFVTDRSVFTSPRVIAIVSLFVVLGASQYLLIIHRSHAGSLYLEYVGRDVSAERFFDYVTGGDFRDSAATFSGDYLREKTLPRITKELDASLGVIVKWLVGVALVLGLATYWRSRLATFLAMNLFFQIAWVLTFAIGDINAYYLPVYLLSSLLLVYVVERIEKPAIVTALGLMMLALPMMKTVENHRAMQSFDNPLERRAKFIVESLPANAVLFAPKGGGWVYQNFVAINYFLWCAGCDHTKSVSYQVPGEVDEFYMPGWARSWIERPEEFEIALHQRGVTVGEFIASRSQDATLVLSIKGDGTRYLAPQSKRALTRMGLQIDRLQPNGSLVAVIERGRVRAQQIDNARAIETTGAHLGISRVGRVVSAGFKRGNRSIVEVDGIDRSANHRGFNVVILDADGRFSESLSIDTFRGEGYLPDVFVAKRRKTADGTPMGASPSTRDRAAPDPLP